MDKKALNELLDQGYTHEEARAELRGQERQKAKARKSSNRPQRYRESDADMDSQYEY